MSTKKIIVVGNGMVGCKFLAAMLKNDAEQEF